MAVSEFGLIERYFQRPSLRDDVVLGIGDDCALLQVPAGYLLASSTDTLVEGVHFFADVDPEALGYKALAVNLSDLAAMGAEPAWASLALTLPKADPNWLRDFARGWFTLAEPNNLSLVGGDTTRGPLCITVQLFGFLPATKGLRRDAAQPGERIYVSGTLGDAALALRVKAGSYTPSPLHQQALQQRLERPEPRVQLGILLRDVATAAIDISDGLVADLGHILQASGVGGRVCLNDLPTSVAMQHFMASSGELTLPLQGGDDYELCFTIPAEKEAALTAVCRDAACSLSCIGIIEEQLGLRCYDALGKLILPLPEGYRHF